MITEEVMLKRFYQQNPDYIGKDIEIINDGDGYTINLIKKNGRREWLCTYRGEDVENRCLGMLAAARTRLDRILTDKNES